MKPITPMLARPYYKWQPSFPVDVQHKFDGIRMLSDGLHGWSRELNLFRSVPHILDALRPLAEMMPGIVWDGELYSHSLNNDFNRIVSLVKKQNPTPEELNESLVLEYHIFDFYATYGPEWTWKQRATMLGEYFVNAGLPSCIQLAETWTTIGQSQVDEVYEDALDGGYEGIMLRLPDGPYRPARNDSDRSPHLYKRKPVTTTEFTVLEVLEGLGKCTDMAGKVKLINAANQEFEASLKMSFPARRKLWQERHAVVGKPATVLHGNLTPRGVPRWGRVLAIRNYE